MTRKSETTKRSMSAARKRRGLKYFFMALPFVIFVIAFSYVPLFGWWFAFTDYKMGRPIFELDFVGWQNFIKVFGGRELPRVLRNTFVMSSLEILTSPFPVFFAIMLNEIRGKKTRMFIQTVTTLPNFISWIVVFGVAFSIFSSNGLWNQLMRALNLPYPMMGLMGDSDAVWTFQLGLTHWKGMGWASIIYLAAITGIDTELYDAAKVDGANKIQLIRYITIPGVLPTYSVMLLLSISNFLSNGFEKYYVFWNSLTSDKIEVLDYYIYKLGFGSGQYDYSIAAGISKTIVSLVLLGVANMVSKKIRGNSLI